jgi:hypothetical protein
MTDLFSLSGIDPALYAFAFAVIVVAAIAQSTIGVGFGVVAAPILALLDPAMVPGPMLVLGVATSAMVMVRDRADIRFGNLTWALAGRILASLAGGLTASLLSTQGFLLLFATLILAAVGLSLSGWRLQANRRTLFWAGAASGYMGTITSVGTPPMAIVYQYAPGAEVRANLSAFLVAGGCASIASLALFGAFDLTELAFALKLVPALILGFWLSGPLKRVTDRGWMRPAMLVLCVAASVTLLARGLGMLPGPGATAAAPAEIERPEGDI